MAASPTVSVVITTYNGERFVRQAIQSALDQTLSDVEVVIVDDGSRDATPEILETWAHRDDRLVVACQENRGVSAARNRAIARARGAFIAMLDQDDFSPPDRLRLQVEFLRDHDSVGAVGGAVTFVDEKGRPFVHAVPYPRTDEDIRTALEEAAPLRQSTPFVHSAVLMRAEALRGVGGYRSAFEPAEDLDLWLRLSERWALANLAQTVVCYRIHASQTSLRRFERQVLVTVAARLSAQAGRAGQPDPFASVHDITKQEVISAGATDDDILETYVNLATWLGRTCARAGYRTAAMKLLHEAEERARQTASPEALQHVNDTRARIAGGRRRIARRLAQRVRAMIDRFR